MTTSARLDISDSVTVGGKVVGIRLESKLNLLEPCVKLRAVPSEVVRVRPVGGSSGSA